MGPTSLAVSMPDAKQNKNPVGVTQPRTDQFLTPQPLDRAAVKIDPGQDPRKMLADWITDPKNEYFAGAMVNRIWAHYFNVGLVEPIDDLRESNPPSNPELWQALVKEFVAKKYDRKHMMRLILNSRAYQLSSTTRPANEKDHALLFALLRPPAAIGGAARRHLHAHGRSRSIRRLSARLAGGADSRSERAFAAARGLQPARADHSMRAASAPAT